VALQRGLQDLGFLPPGPIDGVYGRGSRGAILAWQAGRGLVTTGLLGDTDASVIKRRLLQVARRLAQVRPRHPWNGRDSLKNDGGYM